MYDLISRKALLKGLPVHPEGGLRSIKEEFLMLEVREEIRNAPTIPAVPLDKLCEWLGKVGIIRCDECTFTCFKNEICSSSDHWEKEIKKWMEGLDAAD